MVPAVCLSIIIYSTTSFRVRILLPRSHTCALQSIRISCHVAVLACGRFGLWPNKSRFNEPLCGHPMSVAYYV